MHKWYNSPEGQRLYSFSFHLLPCHISPPVTVHIKGDSFSWSKSQDYLERRVAGSRSLVWHSKQYACIYSRYDGVNVIAYNNVHHNHHDENFFVVFVLGNAKQTKVCIMTMGHFQQGDKFPEYDLYLKINNAKCFSSCFFFHTWKLSQICFASAIEFVVEHDKTSNESQILQ